MAIAYTAGKSRFQVVANIYHGEDPQEGAVIWSSEEGRHIPCSYIRAGIALRDMAIGPIFADAEPHNHPETFKNVEALCRYVIRSGGKVIISTVE